MIVCILNHLDDFEYDAPQLDFAGHIHGVEEYFGDLEYLHFVGCAPQLCLVGYTIEVGESFDMFDCLHTIVA